MASVHDLVTTAPFAAHLTALLDVGLDREVDAVHVAETRGRIGDAPPHALIVLTDPDMARAPAFYLDVALRQAAERDAAALVLRAAERSIVSHTSATLARRARLALLSLDPSLDLARLVIAVEREVRPDAHRSLAQLDRLRRIIDEVDEQLSPDALVERMNAAGAGLRVEGPESDAGTPVVCDGIVERRMVGDASDLGERAVTERLAADALARALAYARRAEQAPIQSRAELISELLSSRPEESTPLIRRARELGLAIDGWHVIVAIQAEFDGQPDPLTRVDTAARIERLAIDTARASGGGWHRARIGEHLLLVMMERQDPGAQANAAVLRTIRRVVERVGAAEPQTSLYCGVSGLHPGAGGLWSCLLEARTAARTARLDGVAGTAVLFDATGVNRTIAEWYGTESARRSVSALLEPLNELDDRRRTEALETLRTYFDHQGSLSRTAAALYVHRNTVTYRIQRIVELLGVDLEDPDQRLMLELACRARELAHSPSDKLTPGRGP